MAEPLRFESSARLQALLGRQLLSNEYMALTELIKNAWDAGAREVAIRFEFGNTDVAVRISIIDDGRGMNKDEFVEEWMTIGHSTKRRSVVRGRAMAGEKGIGRFATDKLAKRVTVVTRPTSSTRALTVEFDWDQFDQADSEIGDIAVPYAWTSAGDIESESGTKLVLSKLRSSWSEARIQSLAADLSNFLEPGAERDFTISVRMQRAQNETAIDITPRQLPSDVYAFEFAHGEGELTERTRRPRAAARELHRPTSERSHRRAGAALEAVGPLEGTFFYVDSKWSLNRLGLEPGVRIYRDGFRVEPYGRTNDDWLGVKAYKASRQGQAPVAPSRLFGFISISRRQNPQLQDVTSREGLIENEAFAALKDFATTRFRRFAAIIGEEIKRPAWTQRRQEKQREEAERDESRRIQAEAQTYWDMASRIAHHLRQPLQTMLSDAGNIRERTQVMRNRDSNLEATLLSLEKAISAFDDSITFMGNAANGLKDTARPIDLRRVVQDTVDSLGVEAEIIVPQRARVSAPPQALGFVLANLLRNAARAAPGTSVRVRATVDDSSIVVAVEDDGPGVPQTLRERLFIDYVESQVGMGFGLMDSRIVARKHGGDLTLDSPVSPTRFRLTMPQGENDGR